MKNMKWLSIILIVLILVSSALVFADEVEETKEMAYEAGFQRAIKDAETMDNLKSDNDIRALYDGVLKNDFLDGYKDGFAQAKLTYGEKLGKALGLVFGAKDFKDKKSSEWSRHLPSDLEIITMYDLNKETDAYKTRFLFDFKKEFEIGYKEAYEKANLDPTSQSAEAGKRDGTKAGDSLGKLFGIKDFKNGNTNNFRRTMPSDLQIVIDYSLNNDNKGYKEAFIINFKVAFELAYEKSYREANLEDKEGEAQQLGYNLGYTDGKKIADDNKKSGILLPINLVRLTNAQVLSKYSLELSGKNDVYKDKFLKGYQEGFTKGYDASNMESGEELDGYNRGYTDGKALASQNNTDKKFTPYEQVKMTDQAVMGKNYEYLKDKGAQFILNFVKGYQEGFEKGYKETIKAGEDPEEPEDGVALSSGFGAAFGMNYGEIAGLQDYEKGVSPNWSRAIPKDTELDRLFNLRNLPREERNAFIEQFRKNFEIGYEKAYYEGHFGAIRNSLTAGTADGSQFGGNLGAIFGSKDYYEGRDSDYKRDLPSDYIIESEYALNLDNKEYLQGFVNGFKKAYQEEYIKSFREAKNNAFLMDQSMGYENGLSVGNIQGSTQATMDYMQKKTNDWNRSKPAASSLIFEFNLMYQPEKYRDSFISGFWDGYSKGYTDTYKEVSQTSNETKTVSQTIPISGATLMSLDGAMAVTIKPGTYYKPVILKIDTLNDSLYSFDKNYISASNYYKISLINPNNNAFNNESKIELSFEYYGGKKGGVYKMQNGQWQYMDSTRDDSSIAIMVNPRNLLAEGSVYAVMLNEEVKTFHDIRGHWAKDEIETLIRRNIIYGYTDNTFKAENKITRAEFLTLLSRVYKWQLPTYTANTMQFKDYASFGNRNNIISYALAHGYINGYPDNTFRPNDHISYRELEIIMRRFIDKEFKWHHTAAKMLYEKKARTSFYDSIDNKINRGEVSYMLYILNDWRY